MILRWGARLVGAGMLGATAGIHLYLWDDGYRSIPKIGPLFLVNGIAGSLLCLAVLGSPRILLRWVALAGMGLEAGTAIGLLITVKHGLFGFRESTQAMLFWQSVWVEIIGTVILAALVLSPGHKARPVSASSRA